MGLDVLVHEDNLFFNYINPIDMIYNNTTFKKEIDTSVNIINNNSIND